MLQSSSGNDCDITVVEKYANMVYKLAFARVKNRNDADDIFQEVFLTFVRRNPKFENEEHEKAWFIRVTINCSKDFWKYQNRRNHDELNENIEGETPEEEILTEYLDKLPEDYRIIIHLFYYEDMPTKDIAKAMAKKESTIRMALTRARRMLKEFMEGDEADA